MKYNATYMATADHGLLTLRTASITADDDKQAVSAMISKVFRKEEAKAVYESLLGSLSMESDDVEIFIEELENYVLNNYKNLTNIPIVMYNCDMGEVVYGQCDERSLSIGR